MKRGRLEWRWRSSLQAERSGAGPDRRICVSLTLSGRNPKMTHVHRDVLALKIIGRETPACRITVATETREQTRLESRRSRATDGSLDSAPRDSSGSSKGPAMAPGNAAGCAAPRQSWKTCLMSFSDITCLIAGPPVHWRFCFPPQNFPRAAKASHWCSLSVRRQLLRALAVDASMAEWTERSNKKSPLANPGHDGTS